MRSTPLFWDFRWGFICKHKKRRIGHYRGFCNGSNTKKGVRQVRHYKKGDQARCNVLQDKKRNVSQITNGHMLLCYTGNVEKSGQANCSLQLT